MNVNTPVMLDIFYSGFHCHRMSNVTNGLQEVYINNSAWTVTIILLAVELAISVRVLLLPELAL